MLLTWLLIVDKADDSEILFGTVESNGIIDYHSKSQEGVTVYNTFTIEVAASLTRGVMLELGVMSRQDAAEFLEKSIREDLHNEAATILTRLPLAIAQAAAYLNKNRMSIAKYLHLLGNTEQDVISLISREFCDDTR
jgi:predicted nucleic acid-binding protein